MENVKWEYLKVLINDKIYLNVNQQLNKLGLDGWELISIKKEMFYFKRQLIKKN